MASFTSQILIQEARKRGLHMELLDEAHLPLIRVTIPGHEPAFLYSCVSNTSTGVGVAVNRNKLATYLVADQLGIPTSTYKMYDADHPEEADMFLMEQLGLGYELVIKPIDQDHGKGVSVGITDLAALHQAVKHAETFSKRIIMQRRYFGDDCRFTVVDGKCIAAIRRVPPFVVGDGTSTLRQLVANENQQRYHSRNQNVRLREIRLPDVERFLGVDALQSVPSKGSVIVLLGTANFGRGGAVEDITEDVHPSYKQTAEKLAHSLGLGVCGADFMCADYTKELSADNTALLEINCAIGLRPHHFPNKGKPRNVAGAILDAFIKYNKSSVTHKPRVHMSQKEGVV